MPTKIKIMISLAYMAAIFALSSIPDTGAPQNLAERLLRWATPEFQNLFHIPLFGGLAAIWNWALREPLPRPLPRLALVLFITAAYAVFDEWHQLHVPGRYGSLTDIALDLAGITGVLAYLATRITKGTTRKP